VNAGTGSIAGVSVRPFAAGDASRWDAFVHTCADATFFHRLEWRGIYESVFKHRTHYLLAERAGQVTGVLPLVTALHEAAVQLGRQLGVRHLEMRNRGVREASWPRQDLYVTFRREILPEVEANMLAIPRKQRAMVRKGVARELRCEIDRSSDRFFELYADNQHRHGTPPQSKRYFDALIEAFGDDCELAIVLSPQGKPVSGVLSFYFRDEVLPYYAGDVTDARDLAANDFKYWDLMRRACERGLKVFDYGRSKRGTGSFDFKRNWGFEPQPLHYEHFLYVGDEVPQNNPSNAKYRAAIDVWRRLPRGVVNSVGPALARYLG
jgi:FemAB-related protein (PEP-CTERM system-associated)